MSERVELIFIKENDSKDKFNLVLKDESNYKKDETDICKLKSNYVDFEKSIEKLKNFCELKEVDISNFMEEVVKFIELDDLHIGDMKDCYTNSTNMYQIMYKIVTQFDNINELPMNMLGSFISYDKGLLYNKCVLMNTFVSNDGLNDKLENCNFNSLINMILNIEYHSCVYVDEDSNFKQILINNNNEIVDPHNKFRKDLNMKQLLLEEDSEILEKNYLNFELVFVFKRKEDDKLNEPVSRLLHGLVKGDCIIYSKGLRSFNDLLVNDVLNLLKVWNKFTIIESDFEKLNNKEKNKYHLLNDRLEL
jgi:hypothetical protein